MKTHITPINDKYPHHESDKCPCNPIKDSECPDVIIHNSFDGREFYEHEKTRLQ